MRIAVLNAQVPFIWGGAEEMAHHLTLNLNRMGHEAQLVRIPMSWEPPTRVVNEALMCQLLNLDHFDAVIGTKFPNYGIRHRNMRIWLVHQYRQAYDLWDAGQSNIPNDEAGNHIRRAIIAYDREAFARAQKITCVAEPIRHRLKHYMGIDAPVTLIPVNDEELFADKARDNYIFAGGRVNQAKRQHLLIEALAKTRSDIRLVIAGPPDNPSDANQLEKLVKQLGLKDRVTLDLRFVERERIADYMNRCLAAAYLPFQEDSVGYVTAEAFLAKKPVLTTNDSGGVLEIVIDSETGLVAGPEATDIAAAIDRFAGGVDDCVQMGVNGNNVWRSRGISWERSIATLLE